jgi:NTP pyrophosphatase (non-canonical NTP hydrolase)
LKTLSDIQAELAAWAAEAVPDADHLAKMREEFDELLDKPGNAHEMADLFMALLVHASSCGVDIEAAVMEKLQIVKGRTYGAPDENGVARHIRHKEMECGKDSGK